MILNVEEPYDFHKIEMTRTWMESAYASLKQAEDEKLRQRMDEARRDARESMHRTVLGIAKKIDLALHNELAPKKESDNEKKHRDKMPENLHRKCNFKKLFALSKKFDMFGSSRKDQQITG